MGGFLQIQTNNTSNDLIAVVEAIKNEIHTTNGKLSPSSLPSTSLPTCLVLCFVSSLRSAHLFLQCSSTTKIFDRMVTFGRSDLFDSAIRLPKSFWFEKIPFFAKDTHITYAASISVVPIIFGNYIRIVVVLIGVTLLSKFLDWENRMKLKVIGDIPQGLPDFHFFSVDWDLSMFPIIWFFSFALILFARLFSIIYYSLLVLASFKASMAIAIIGFMEGISLAKKFAGTLSVYFFYFFYFFHFPFLFLLFFLLLFLLSLFWCLVGLRKYRIDVSQELRALGLANIST